MTIENFVCPVLNDYNAIGHNEALVLFGDKSYDPLKIMCLYYNSEKKLCSPPNDDNLSKCLCSEWKNLHK